MKIEIIDDVITVEDSVGDNAMLILNEAKELLSVLPIMIGKLDEKLNKSKARTREQAQAADKARWAGKKLAERSGPRVDFAGEPEANF